MWDQGNILTPVRCREGGGAEFKPRLFHWRLWGGEGVGKNLDRMNRIYRMKYISGMSSVASMLLIGLRRFHWVFLPRRRGDDCRLEHLWEVFLCALASLQEPNLGIAPALRRDHYFPEQGRELLPHAKAQRRKGDRN